MPGGACCAAGICCPPGSPEQVDAVSNELDGMRGCPPDSIDRDDLANEIVRRWDLVPKGTTKAIKEERERDRLPESLMRLYAPLFEEAASKASG